MSSTDSSTSDKPPLHGSQDCTNIKPSLEDNIGNVVSDSSSTSLREGAAEPEAFREPQFPDDTEVIEGKGMCLSRKKDGRIFWEFRSNTGKVHDQEFSSPEQCRDFAQNRA